MADTVTSQLIVNGPRNLVIALTNLSDGTGQSSVKVVDAQSATYAVNQQGQLIVPGVHLKLTGIDYQIGGMIVKLQWDATTPVDLYTLTGYDRADFKKFGGIPNPNTAGATGSILLTTVGQVANSTYSIVLHMIKGVPQS